MKRKTNKKTIFFSFDFRAGRSVSANRVECEPKNPCGKNPKREIQAQANTKANMRESTNQKPSEKKIEKQKTK